MESGVPNPVTISIKIALGLALIIGLIYLVCLILKRIQENKASTYGRPVMELISTINLGLGPGKSIHMVRAADKVFVIGATTAKITLLAEIDTDLDKLTAQNKPRETEPGKERRFDQLLAEY
ncbi:MAG: flagellar biosynthetic protein FliO, partial [Firmicutes bacterium]|nr:flagellar biosynthetic protein FliO [Bacillota bacterium]